MKGIIKFNRGVLRMSWPVKVWLLLLVAANGVVPLFFLPHAEALMILGAMLIVQRYIVDVVRYASGDRKELVEGL